MNKVKRIYVAPEDVLKNEMVMPTSEITLDSSDAILARQRYENVPVKVVRVQTPAPQQKYLVLSSSYRFLGTGHQGVLVPDVFIYDKNGKPLKARKILVGDDAACGLFRCVRTIYEVTHPEKMDRVVLTPDSKNIGRDLAEVSTTRSTRGVAALTTSATVYSDIVGKVSISVRETLPKLMPIYFHKESIPRF